MTGYVRKDTTNNIADGNVINAADLDSEFDGVQDGFNASTGHTHGGAAGEGAPITRLGPTQDVTASAVLLAPKTTNTVDIGSSALKFKDLFLAGNASIGGTLAVTGVATFTAQPILSSLTASRAVFSDGSKGLVSNAITGTGNVVMSASPTLTGTAGLENITASGTLGVTGVATFTAQPIVSSLTASRAVFSDGSKGLVSNAITGTGNVVMSASPTLTGTIAAEALTASSTVTLSGGTANGVAYLNGSKVLTSGSALTFDGNRLAIAGSSASTNRVDILNDNGNATFRVGYDTSNNLTITRNTGDANIYLNATQSGAAQVWQLAGTEGMRLTSTGLGIGTSSPSNKLVVSNSGANGIEFNPASGQMVAYNRSTSAYSTLTLLGLSFAIQTGTSPVSRLVINDSGNLGLGTTSPTSQFVVSNAGAAGLEIQPTGVGSAPVIISYNRSGAAYTQLTNLALQHVWQNSGTEVARIDSAGNLGLGVTPSAWTTFDKVLQVGASSLANYSNFDNTMLGSNVYYGGSPTAFRYITTGQAATMYRSVAGALSWSVAASGTAGDAISFTQAMTLDASGNLFVGTTSGSDKLNIAGNATLTVTQPAYGLVDSSNSNYKWIIQNISSALRFYDITANVERARIDSSGRVGIATTSPLAPLQINSFGGLDGNGNQFYITNNQYFDSVDARDESIKAGYSNRIVLDNNAGGILFQSTSTSAAGANTAITLSERARIDSSGNLLVGTTTANPAVLNAAGAMLAPTRNEFSVDGSVVGIFNRKTDDGEIIQFRQAGTTEGTISVSGTTVSYNGGHLSRWAQTTTAKDESLVKGTVLSNLDEMNVYTKDGQPVANEQLNKVKVSDSEGDANVAGVFVNWTHDEDHNVDEINMAMTGDMIIRIAQGVTVVRGDLLMSAGDGTAKPQGDDIIRSKTVAKVTSNHVTCTYADGSYCVPCVLMAC